MKKKKESIELPDIQQFLNTSRTMVRQLELLEDTDIPEDHERVTKKAAKKVIDAANRYVKGGEE